MFMPFWYSTKSCQILLWQLEQKWTFCQQKNVAMRQQKRHLNPINSVPCLSQLCTLATLQRPHTSSSGSTAAAAAGAAARAGGSSPGPAASASLPSTPPSPSSSLDDASVFFFKAIASASLASSLSNLRIGPLKCPEQTMSTTSTRHFKPTMSSSPSFPPSSFTSSSSSPSSFSLAFLSPPPPASFASPPTFSRARARSAW